jgi:hypothetical protein
MSIAAVRTTRIDRSYAEATERILFVRNRLEMVRVDATPNAAQVVEL